MIKIILFLILKNSPDAAEINSLLMTRPDSFCIQFVQIPVNTLHCVCALMRQRKPRKMPTCPYL